MPGRGSKKALPVPHTKPVACNPDLLKRMLNSIIYKVGMDEVKPSAIGQNNPTIIKDLIKYTKKKEKITTTKLIKPAELKQSSLVLKTDMSELKRFIASSKKTSDDIGRDPVSSFAYKLLSAQKLHKASAQKERFISDS